MSTVRPTPRPAPSADAVARVALAAELARTQRLLFIERALRAHPAAAPVADLITAYDEEGIRDQAARLAAYASA
jgi:hypothetical protein